ncbi:MAG: parallel beta-helix domain-containing protein [Chitinophagaceae bacterium]|nr:parallel beta-helix domain-containing protein [Chitinophagaceae bacterium]
MNFRLLILFCLVSFVSAAQPDVQKKWQTRFIMAEDGATIEAEEGNFSFSSTLSVEGRKNIIIRGKGIDKTILSFKGQNNGAEGLRISNCTNIVLEDLTVQDAKGDCIKAMNVNGITFRRVKAEWTGQLSKKNGSYALYPVQCEKVLIENCIARGSSDAGIYVGQSKNIIVRNNKAYENVAGIEIENSLYADVYGNEAVNNTGGILVFDLPDLQVKKGGYCRVFNNLIKDNNTVNFAPKGNIVAKVPQGTGILLLAANNVEVFNNKIINNRTVGTGIVSYYITENEIKDSAYYPYPVAISIHDNVYEKEKRRATMRGRMGKLYRFKLKFGKNVPDIVYDGVPDEKITEANAVYKPEYRICLQNNNGATYANLDAVNNFKKISRDSKPCDCFHKALAEVKL